MAPPTSWLLFPVTAVATASSTMPAVFYDDTVASKAIIPGTFISSSPLILRRKSTFSSSRVVSLAMEIPPNQSLTRKIIQGAKRKLMNREGSSESGNPPASQPQGEEKLSLMEQYSYFVREGDISGESIGCRNRSREGAASYLKHSVHPASYRNQKLMQ